MLINKELSQTTLLILEQEALKIFRKPALQIFQTLI